jgi:hypothetical protein
MKILVCAVASSLPFPLSIVFFQAAPPYIYFFYVFFQLFPPIVPFVVPGNPALHISNRSYAIHTTALFFQIVLTGLSGAKYLNTTVMAFYFFHYYPKLFFTKIKKPINAIRFKKMRAACFPGTKKNKFIWLK